MFQLLQSLWPLMIYVVAALKGEIISSGGEYTIELDLEEEFSSLALDIRGVNVFNFGSVTKDSSDASLLRFLVDGRGVDIDDWQARLYNLRSPSFWDNPQEFEPEKFLRTWENNGIEGWTGFDPSRSHGALYPNEVLDFVQKEEQVLSFTLRRLPTEISVSESLRYKLLGGLAVRRACYGVFKSNGWM
ncbi:unnamed protein product [Eruca vesicaria subsp. sativa]|uniref:Uncharacterized protein n=1 Tax=Eruca vesicaria subsp. sativa TaxID=29727 RepID=A0ABC8KFD5_ERUVS|nr:unnamed protein product [Eruca vesicaria subsp. sativa]